MSYFFYFVSITLTILLVMFTRQDPMRARFAYAFLFLCAGLINGYFAWNSPDLYLRYAVPAWGPYEEFILGPFPAIVRTVILWIAIGQALLAFLFLARGILLKIACLGSMVFFLAITPLGMGAAFPLPLIALVGSLFIYKEADRASVGNQSGNQAPA